MNTTRAIAILMLLCLPPMAMGESRGPVTVLGAFRNPETETIVVSVHHLRDGGIKEHVLVPLTGAYLVVDGVKYPVDSSDSVRSGSRTKGVHVIDEYVVRRYRIQGESKEIPGLRNARSIVFGLDYTVNGSPVRLEQKVNITLFAPKAEQTDAVNR